MHWKILPYTRTLRQPHLFSLMTRVVVCLSFAISTIGSAEVLSFKDNWGEAGFNLVSQSNSGVEVVFSVTEMALNDLEIDGQVMQLVQIPGIYLPNDPGAPNLPGTGRYIAIPQGASVRVEILDSRSEVYSNLDVAPAPPIPLETDDSPPIYQKNPDIYSKNSYYPQSPVNLSEVQNMRGVDCVILGISPFQYNPITRDLLVYKDIRVRVEFIGGNGHFGEDRLRSRYWEPILRQHLINYESLPEVDLNRLPQMDEDNCEYVIIVPDDPVFMAWADSIKQWRNQQGIITGITPLSEIGGNDATLISNYLINAYYTWDVPPVAVLLLSDYQYSGDEYGITSPVWNGYCVSDNIYADMNADGLPDLAIARITAQDEVHLETMIHKFLDYERNPPTDPGFYDHPIMAGGWQDERWFILCTEVIQGYFETQHGKSPVREYAIYSGNPGSQWSTNQNTWMIVNYFGPGGLGYIPSTPDYLIDWGGNASRINNDINSGAFILQHRDHGSELGWGEPDYNVSHLYSLNNTMLPFVFSTNCLTGKYNWSGQCFTEAFHRIEHGALGLIAASEVSYSFVNDTYQWGVYDSMWPDFDPGYGMDLTGSNTLRPCFGNASGKYYLQTSGWPSNPNNKVHTYHLFHHHGDAFITLYSEVPQELTVTHAPVLFPDMTGFAVTADSGAVIALTVNGEIIGVAEATGSSVNVPIEPQQPGSTMLVTVTLQNYYRYTEEVDIITQEENYVIFSELGLNDATGNNNQLLDLGEDVLLTIAVQNFGTQTASNIAVTISTEDEYATILDSTEVYASIPSGGRAVVYDGFEISALSNIPDLHIIDFTMNATNGDSTWVSFFNITAHAPIVAYQDHAISDPTGNNNGHLDPGETADFDVSISNEGSGDVSDLTFTLDCTEPLITINNNSTTLGELSSGANAIISFEEITADEDIMQGDTVLFVLNVSAANGYEASAEFSVIVGDLRHNPIGPDAYGYYAYDLYDGPDAPVFDWLEIAPQAGGNGTDLELGDAETALLDLPFPFRFYGYDYDQITVCSHGWMSFGIDTVFFPMNRPIPDGVPPNKMVAGIWDDLNPALGGQVCYYDDYDNFRFVVEWYDVPHSANPGIEETFQVMIYDPIVYITPTGDGEIVVNYQDVSNYIDGCTVGIENHDGTVGIQFLYDDEYDALAMPLEDGFAIKYSTAEPIVVTEALSTKPLPKAYLLSQNYPNPFNPTTHLSFSLPKSGNVSMIVYDIQGREVARLVDGWRNAGSHDVTFDGDGLASGIYLVRITAGQFSQTRKMVLLK